MPPHSAEQQGVWVTVKERIKQQFDQRAAAYDAGAGRSGESSAPA